LGHLGKVPRLEFPLGIKAFFTATGLFQFYIIRVAKETRGFGNSGLVIPTFIPVQLNFFGFLGTLPGFKELLFKGKHQLKNIYFQREFIFLGSKLLGGKNGKGFQNSLITLLILEMEIWGRKFQSFLGGLGEMLNCGKCWVIGDGGNFFSLFLGFWGAQIWGRAKGGTFINFVVLLEISLGREFGVGKLKGLGYPLPLKGDYLQTGGNVGSTFQYKLSSPNIIYCAKGAPLCPFKFWGGVIFITN